MLFRSQPGLQLRQLQARLERIIDVETDSIRYYYLGDEWRRRVRHEGVAPDVDIEGTLFL